MGENDPVTASKRRETWLAWARRKHKSIALWGGSFLASDLIWRTAWITTKMPDPQAAWWGLILLAGGLPLAVWTYLFFITGDEAEYRALVMTGKVLPPEEVEKINAVKLKPKKLRLERTDLWETIDQKEFGKPDPGYGPRVNWAPRLLQGPLFFLRILLILMVPMLLFQAVNALQMTETFRNEAVIHFAGLFSAMLAGALVAGFRIMRSHARIWAEFRASKKPPQ